jgi:hypothetical protein
MLAIPRTQQMRPRTSPAGCLPRRAPPVALTSCGLAYGFGRTSRTSGLRCSATARQSALSPTWRPDEPGQTCPAPPEAVACRNGEAAVGAVLETRAVLAAPAGAKLAAAWVKAITLAVAPGAISVPPSLSLTT